MLVREDKSRVVQQKVASSERSSGDVHTLFC